LKCASAYQCNPLHEIHVYNSMYDAILDHMHNVSYKAK
jgi:hypothetical protein